MSDPLNDFIRKALNKKVITELRKDSAGIAEKPTEKTPKAAEKKVTTKKKTTKPKKTMRKKSKKAAKAEKNRFSIFTKKLENCYICSCNGKITKKEDLHEIFEGRNRMTSIKYGLVIPVCRSCHNKLTDDQKLIDEWHKKGQKQFKKFYKSENFIQIFGKNYL